MSRRLPAGLLPLLFLAACGNPAADLEPHRAAVLKKLEAFDAAGRTARAESAIRANSLRIPGPAPSFPPGSHNSVLLSLEDFPDLTTASKESRLVVVNPLYRIAAWARKGKTPWGTDLRRKEVDQLQSEIPAFLQLKYVLVARTIRVVEPQLAGNDFRGGSIQADAILIDLDDGTSLGGLSFRGSNDDVVSVKDRSEKAWLAGNLRKNTLAALASAFQQQVPGASPPVEEPAR